MCNRYRNRLGLRDWAEDFSTLKIPLRFPPPGANLPSEIRPTNQAAVFRPIDAADPAAGIEGAVMRWGLIPWFHKTPVKAWKALCTNARAETIATTPSFREAYRRRRCLVPADGYFEWTGAKSPKTKWLFTVAGQDRFCFAGLWDHAETADGPITSFTIATTAAGPDAAAYHDRQPVILAREHWLDWLDLARPAQDLLAPSPAGLIEVVRAEAEPT